MHKEEFIKHIAKTGELQQKDAKEVLELVLRSFKTALEQGESVRLIGFGSFEVKEVAARKGHNPSTGQEMMIPSYNKISFKIGKELKEAINS